jgi:hypothetical protein
MLNGLYSVTHPFSSASNSAPNGASPMSAELPPPQASPSPAP